MSLKVSMLAIAVPGHLDVRRCLSDIGMNELKIMLNKCLLYFVIIKLPHPTE
jgi:hypothetical protein